MVRFLNKKTDLDQVNEWLRPKVSAKELPGHTFCFDMDGDIIAIAGFRLMEGEICFIDSMATNQKWPGEIRNIALDELTIKILDTAKSLGFKKIFATTKEDCIVRRAEKHGFRILNQIVIGREI
jgi:N-acetylglutamate synthase-like GNAT family acetyltransferase